MCGARWGDSTEVVKHCNLHRQATVATCHIWMPHLIMTAALSAMIPSPCHARQIVLTGSAVSSLFCTLGWLAIYVEGGVNMMWVGCTHQAIYMIFLYTWQGSAYWEFGNTAQCCSHVNALYAGVPSHCSSLVRSQIHSSRSQRWWASCRTLPSTTEFLEEGLSASCRQSLFFLFSAPLFFCLCSRGRVASSFFVMLKRVGRLIVLLDYLQLPFSLALHL